jgi:uncharacterized protein (TIGR00255 family)
MLQSMTGFGKAAASFDGKKISIEIRALNSKGLDLTVRTHNSYRELEAEIRKIVTDDLERGKVDVNVVIEDRGESTSVRLNQSLVKEYYTDLKKTNMELGETSLDYLSMIVRFPEVFTNEKQVLSKEEKDWVLNLVCQSSTKLKN